jgi:hypothetical protein
VTTVTDIGAPAPVPASLSDGPADHRGSWIPTLSMITTRIMELRKRRGLMIALIVVNIGLPTLFLVIRLLGHAFDPTSYGPAGGYDIYTHLVAGVMYVFGFIVAAALGCTAGSIDLTEGMFRHLVVTGRSRVSLYLARIPAGLAIVVPLVAIGFTIVCAVCVFAAPTRLEFNGVTVPVHLSLPGLENWAADHPDEVVCNFGINLGPNSSNASVIGPVLNSVPCGPGPGPGSISVKQPPGLPAPTQVSQAQVRKAARLIARANYSDYARQFLYPSNSLMIKSGLWLELEAAIGFIVGLGLGSLLGQRTVAVILMIVLEVVLTPLLSTNVIRHLINLQRAVVGLATAHLEPGGLPLAFAGGGNGGPGGGGGPHLVPESTTVAVCVIVAWVIGWTVLGAWRMTTRDA